MYKSTRIILAIVLLGILVACSSNTQRIEQASQEEDNEPLKVAFIPGGDPDLEMQLFGDIVENVGEQIGQPIELQKATSYASIVEGLREGHLDIARLGPFTYILAREQNIPIEPIVIENLLGKGTSYKCILIARKDQQIEFDWTPETARQITIGLVEESSTSGSVIPQAEGMKYEPPITLNSWEEVAWTGSHNASIAAVQENHVDAAFVADRRLYAAIRTDVIEEDEIEVLWESGPITNSPFVARRGLGLETMLKLEWAFRHVPNTQLKAANLSGFATIADSDYAYIYRVGKEYEKIKD